MPARPYKGASPRRIDQQFHVPQDSHATTQVSGGHPSTGGGGGGGICRASRTVTSLSPPPNGRVFRQPLECGEWLEAQPIDEQAPPGHVFRRKQGGEGGDVTRAQMNEIISLLQSDPTEKTMVPSQNPESTSVLPNPTDTLADLQVALERFVGENARVPPNDLSALAALLAAQAAAEEDGSRSSSSIQQVQGVEKNSESTRIPEVFLADRVCTVSETEREKGKRLPQTTEDQRFVSPSYPQTFPLRGAHEPRAPSSSAENPPASSLSRILDARRPPELLPSHTSPNTVGVSVGGRDAEGHRMDMSPLVEQSECRVGVRVRLPERRAGHALAPLCASPVGIPSSTTADGLPRTSLERRDDRGEVPVLPLEGVNCRSQKADVRSPWVSCKAAVGIGQSNRKITARVSVRKNEQPTAAGQQAEPSPVAEETATPEFPQRQRESEGSRVKVSTLGLFEEAEQRGCWSEGGPSSHIPQQFVQTPDGRDPFQVPLSSSSPLPDIATPPSLTSRHHPRELTQVEVTLRGGESSSTSMEEVMQRREGGSASFLPPPSHPSQNSTHIQPSTHIGVETGSEEEAGETEGRQGPFAVLRSLPIPPHPGRPEVKEGNLCGHERRLAESAEAFAESERMKRSEEEGSVRIEMGSPSMVTPTFRQMNKQGQGQGQAEAQSKPSLPSQHPALRPQMSGLHTPTAPPLNDERSSHVPPPPSRSGGSQRSAREAVRSEEQSMLPDGCEERDGGVARGLPALGFGGGGGSDQICRSHSGWSGQPVVGGQGDIRGNAPRLNGGGVEEQAQQSNVRVRVRIDTATGPTASLSNSAEELQASVTIASPTCRKAAEGDGYEGEGERKGASGMKEEEEEDEEAEVHPADLIAERILREEGNRHSLKRVRDQDQANEGNSSSRATGGERSSPSQRTVSVPRRSRNLPQTRERERHVPAPETRRTEEFQANQSFVPSVPMSVPKESHVSAFGPVTRLPVASLDLHAGAQLSSRSSCKSLDELQGIIAKAQRTYRDFVDASAASSKVLEAAGGKDSSSSSQPRRLRSSEDSKEPRREQPELPETRPSPRCVLTQQQLQDSVGVLQIDPTQDIPCWIVCSPKESLEEQTEARQTHTITDEVPPPTACPAIACRPADGSALYEDGESPRRLCPPRSPQRPAALSLALPETRTPPASIVKVRGASKNQPCRGLTNILPSECHTGVREQPDGFQSQHPLHLNRAQHQSESPPMNIFINHDQSPTVPVGQSIPEDPLSSPHYPNSVAVRDQRHSVVCNPPPPHPPGAQREGLMATSETMRASACVSEETVHHHTIPPHALAVPTPPETRPCCVPDSGRPLPLSFQPTERKAKARPVGSSGSPLQAHVHFLPPAGATSEELGQRQLRCTSPGSTSLRMSPVLSSRGSPPRRRDERRDGPRGKLWAGLKEEEGAKSFLLPPSHSPSTPPPPLSAQHSGSRSRRESAAEQRRACARLSSGASSVKVPPPSSSPTRSIPPSSAARATKSRATGIDPQPSAVRSSSAVTAPLSTSACSRTPPPRQNRTSILRASQGRQSRYSGEGTETPGAGGTTPKSSKSRLSVSLSKNLSEKSIPIADTLSQSAKWKNDSPFPTASPLHASCPRKMTSSSPSFPPPVPSGAAEGGDTLPYHMRVSQGGLKGGQRGGGKGTEGHAHRLVRSMSDGHYLTHNLEGLERNSRSQRQHDLSLLYSSPGSSSSPRPRGAIREDTPRSVRIEEESQALQKSNKEGDAFGERLLTETTVQGGCTERTQGPEAAAPAVRMETLSISAGPNSPSRSPSRKSLSPSRNISRCSSRQSLAKSVQISPRHTEMRETKGEQDLGDVVYPVSDANSCEDSGSSPHEALTHSPTEEKRPMTPTSFAARVRSQSSGSALSQSARGPGKPILSSPNPQSSQPLPTDMVVTTEAPVLFRAASFSSLPQKEGELGTEGAAGGGIGPAESPCSSARHPPEQCDQGGSPRKAQPSGSTEPPTPYFPPRERATKGSASERLNVPPLILSPSRRGRQERTASLPPHPRSERVYTEKPQSERLERAETEGPGLSIDNETPVIRPLTFRVTPHPGSPKRNQTSPPRHPCCLIPKDMSPPHSPRGLEILADVVERTLSPQPERPQAVSIPTSPNSQMSYRYIPPSTDAHMIRSTPIMSLAATAWDQFAQNIPQNANGPPPSYPASRPALMAAAGVTSAPSSPNRHQEDANKSLSRPECPPASSTGRENTSDLLKELNRLLREKRRNPMRKVARQIADQLVTLASSARSDNERGGTADVREDCLVSRSSSGTYGPPPPPPPLSSSRRRRLTEDVTARRGGGRGARTERLGASLHSARRRSVPDAPATSRDRLPPRPRPVPLSSSKFSPPQQSKREKEATTRQVQRISSRVPLPREKSRKQKTTTQSPPTSPSRSPPQMTHEGPRVDVSSKPPKDFRTSSSFIIPQRDGTKLRSLDRCQPLPHKESLSHGHDCSQKKATSQGENPKLKSSQFIISKSSVTVPEGKCLPSDPAFSPRSVLSIYKPAAERKRSTQAADRHGMHSSSQEDSTDHPVPENPPPSSFRIQRPSFSSPPRNPAARSAGGAPNAHDPSPLPPFSPARSVPLASAQNGTVLVWKGQVPTPQNFPPAVKALERPSPSRAPFPIPQEATAAAQVLARSRLGASREEIAQTLSHSPRVFGPPVPMAVVGGWAPSAPPDRPFLQASVPPPPVRAMTSHVPAPFFSSTQIVPRGPPGPFSPPLFLSAVAAPPSRAVVLPSFNFIGQR
uniref:Uncharacterized protein n=1 Tax=Chromera velia CCMP2878 TaxID=1169474 RepID=A0A0G4FFN3_9ALVE|eukprot:Cvel_16684.t1-p1 / transcript=Cvel_16684.t1 / gene=Cvel_16684 / organism=Chromera_velia_CCMP2878 / gene_product=Leucine-rich repeat extensin-like protein 5, putative / transcript_product=Leucine-rich repeat extensin-like protein 5, putative / location=Cvel_scaffold1295:16519-25699(+) / protein_length=2751 / sequence_SO=supercontig / SO=protein_coding / is_pseudo=false